MRKTDRIVIRMGAAHNELATAEGVTIPFDTDIHTPYHRGHHGDIPTSGDIAKALRVGMGMPPTKPPKKHKRKERPHAAKGNDKRPSTEPGQTEHGPKRPRRRRRSRGALPVAGPGEP